MHELETLSAPELERLIAGGVSVAVVPFGSIEYQGRGLPIGADAMLADAVGREVARRLGAVLAPTVRVGDAQQHRDSAGTITLRAETLTDVAVQLVESLTRQGFRLVVLVSTHGGNRAALDAAVARLRATPGGAVVCAPRGDVGMQPGAHSGEWLTSVMLALRPELVAHEGDEPGAADAVRGARHLERFVAGIVADAHAAVELR